MPDGAQAWKLIRPPGAKSDRIAQACDRCRSKKIKCDGLRPHCSQCLAVGFECKISDRLLRRAFPRGYTECLEDRIRQLEQENNKLLGLLDVKDEQLELVARVESTMSLNKDSPGRVFDVKGKIEPGQPQHPPSPDSSLAQSSTGSVLSLVEDEDDLEYYSIHQSSTLTPLSTYTGSSSGCGMVRPLMEKMKEKHIDDDIIESVLNCARAMEFSGSRRMWSGSSNDSNRPILQPHLSFALSQISTDQLITIYFQEWQPILPVLDDNEMWSLVEATKKGPEIDKVILYLALSLASLSTRETKSKDTNCLEARKLRNEWKALFTLGLETSPSTRTIQALSLALIYSLHTGQFDDVWHYRGSIVSLMQQLGLNQCQKKLKMPDGRALTFEEQQLRSRLFWIVYTLDALSSAVLGAPPLIRICDVACPLPDMLKPVSEDNSPVNQLTASTTSDPAADIDTCFGAIIELGQIVSGILESIYSCTKASHSYKTIFRLENRLESWRKRLVEPLIFELRHGRPAISSVPLHQKSPLFRMLYDYARVLIHGPALSGSTDSSSAHSTKTSGSHVAIMQSAKSYLQTYNYLNARHVTATLPLPQGRLVMIYGSILLHGTLDYSKGGSLIQESKDITMAALKELELQCQVEWPGNVNHQCLKWMKTAAEAVFPKVKRKSSKGENSKANDEMVNNGPEQKSYETVQKPAHQSALPPISAISPSESAVKSDHFETDFSVSDQPTLDTELSWASSSILDDMFKNRASSEGHSSITIPSNANVNCVNFTDMKEEQTLGLGNDSDPLSYLLLDDLFKEVSWIKS